MRKLAALVVFAATIYGLFPTAKTYNLLLKCHFTDTYLESKKYVTSSASVHINNAQTKGTQHKSVVIQHYR